MIFWTGLQFKTKKKISKWGNVHAGIGKGKEIKRLIFFFY